MTKIHTKRQAGHPWFKHLGLAMASLRCANPAHPELHEQPVWQEATQWPDRIVVTLADNPTTGFSVNWRTNISVGVAIAEIVEADPE